MKSITLHGLDDTMVALLKDRSRSMGMSLNKTIKALLEQALGIKPNGDDTHRADFEEFYGSWTDEQVEEFERATADFGVVDEADWT